MPDTRKLIQNLSFGRIGVIYVWLLEIAIFWIIVPNLFPTAATARAILNNYSISGLAALAVLVPMVSGAFDASIGRARSRFGTTIHHVPVSAGVRTAPSSPS